MGKRRVIIEEEWIYVEGFHPEPTGDGVMHTCRTVADESCAWAVKRLGAELEKSLQFLRNGGEPQDKICID